MLHACVRKFNVMVTVANLPWIHGRQQVCDNVKTGRKIPAEEGCGSFLPETRVEAIAPQPDPRTELNEDDAP